MIFGVPNFYIFIEINDIVYYIYNILNYNIQYQETSFFQFTIIFICYLTAK
jgi:hypothetical protein